jgi:hypothetical protein
MLLAKSGCAAAGPVREGAAGIGVAELSGAQVRAEHIQVDRVTAAGVVLLQNGVTERRPPIARCVIGGR